MNIYEPVYNVDCVECEHTPCVALRTDEGILQCTNLCGLCFFGDRAMLDPDLWNEQKECTE